MDVVTAIDIFIVDIIAPLIEAFLIFGGSLALAYRVGAWFVKDSADVFSKWRLAAVAVLVFALAFVIFFIILAAIWAGAVWLLTTANTLNVILFALSALAAVLLTAHYAEMYEEVHDGD